MGVLLAPLAIDWSDVFLDIVLPKTDRTVGIQWAVLGPIWLLLLGYSWTQDRDIKHFIWGIVVITFAWFLARMIH